MISTQRHLRVNRNEIAYIRFLLEAYDGIATMTTIDPKAGVIRLYVPPGCEKVVDALLEHLKREMPIEALPDTDA